MIEIKLPDGKNKNILFALSGGADSAILLYLIAKLNRDMETNHAIFPFTVPRPDGGANYSPRIVEWISERLNIEIPAPMIVGDGDLKHNIVVKVVINKLLNTNKYDLLYVAENKVPPVEMNGLAPIRAPKATFKRAYLPFWGATKDEILNLYFGESVEELLTLTHTCTEQTVGRCGKCFQCNERAWAFSVINKQDPGTL